MRLVSITGSRFGVGFQECWAEEPVAPGAGLSCIHSQLGLNANLSSQLPWEVFQGFPSAAGEQGPPHPCLVLSPVLAEVLCLSLCMQQSTFPLQEDTGCASEALLL